jgi:hypothetical protein
MESTNNTSPLLPTDNTPNPRKPNLPAKFQKYLAFAFFFSNLLKENNLINDDIFYKALSLFYAFDSFDSQTYFFNSFELQFKPILKSFKLLLKEREKSNKPKKSKKSNKTNTITSDEALINAEETSEHTEKPKKQRKSKKEKKGSQDTEEKSDLIHELLTLANSEPDEV